jgi:hypothetical protein
MIRDGAPSGDAFDSAAATATATCSTTAKDRRPTRSARKNAASPSPDPRSLATKTTPSTACAPAPLALPSGPSSSSSAPSTGNHARGAPGDGRSLLRLADPQQFVLEAFAQAGLTIDVVGKTLLDVMQDAESDHRVEAARLFIDTTVGRAPTTAKNMHLHAKASDKFFNPEIFATTPKPKV